MKVQLIGSFLELHVMKSCRMGIPIFRRSSSESNVEGVETDVVQLERRSLGRLAGPTRKIYNLINDSPGISYFNTPMLTSADQKFTQHSYICNADSAWIRTVGVVNTVCRGTAIESFPFRTFTILTQYTPFSHQDRRSPILIHGRCLLAIIRFGDNRVAATGSNQTVEQNCCEI